MSPDPDVRHMARQVARNDEDGIDPDRIAALPVAGRQLFRSDGDAAKPVAVKRKSSSIPGRACLHFNECKRSCAPRHQVDLAARSARPTGKDPPPVQPKPPGREPLRPASTPLRLLPVQRLRSRARA